MQNRNLIFPLPVAESCFKKQFLFLNIATCPSLGEPTHGRRWGDDFKDGKTVTFGCNKGYDLFGTETIQCNNGFWNGSIPECKGTSYNVYEIIDIAMRRPICV